MIESMYAYISTTFSFCCYILIFKFLRKKNISLNFKKIISLLSISFISFLLAKNNLVLVNFCFNIIFICLLNSIFFKVKIKECIYFGIISYLFAILSDASISMLLTNSEISNFKKFLENDIFRISLIFPVFMISILLILFPPMNYLINVFYDKFIEKDSINKRKLRILILISLLLLILFTLNAYNKVNKAGHFFIIVLIISFVLLSIFIINLMYKEFQIDQVNKKIIEENRYIKEIARQEEEFKHNLVNNLLGIKTVGNKKVNNLIDELILEYKTDYKNITNINDLPEGILSIIYRKSYDENIDNLNLAVDNLLKNELINVLSPKNYNHLCTSIGILFDNALYAVKSCKEKIIEITFLEDNEFIYYVQKNSFNNIIDLEKTGTKDFTTKKNGHGIGLNYISKLKNIEIKNTIINNMFATKLKIKK